LSIGNLVKKTLAVIIPNTTHHPIINLCAQQAMHHSATNQSPCSVQGCVDSYLPHTKQQAPSKPISQWPAQNPMCIPRMPINQISQILLGLACLAH
jgi:hypothetical protein